jgi:hypothetical protein
MERVRTMSRGRCPEEAEEYGAEGIVEGSIKR